MSYSKKYYYSNKKTNNDLMFIISFILLGGYFSSVEFYKQSPILFTLLFLTILILIIYFGIRYKVKEKEKLMNIRTIQDMKKLDWRKFEEFIAFVFKQKGYKAKTRSGKSDGGIDIDAQLNGQKYVIQCKKWTNRPIGRPKIVEFYGAMMSEGKDTKGIFVITTRLTIDARKFAEEKGIELWYESNLEQYVAEYKGETYEIKEEIKQENNEIKEKHLICNKCGGNMVLRKAKRGDHKGENFYGCSNFPKCKNTIILSD